MIPWNKGKKLSQNHIELIRQSSQDRHGKKSPIWKGGKDSLIKKIRRTYKYMEWKNSVLRRDRWACVECNSIFDLNVHHQISLLELLDQFEVKDRIDAITNLSLWKIENGITLCKICHRKTENYGGRERWRKHQK